MRDCGIAAGSAEAQEHGRRAERNAPRLRTHDRYGHRVDEVDYDPSWHWLLRGAVEREIHALPWRSPREGAHVARAALELLWTQAERGRDVPGLDDLLGGAGAAGRSRARRGVGAAAHAPRLRARRAVRDGDDGEAGRLGRPRGHDAGDPGRRRLRPARPQVVLLAPDGRRLPRAGPGARRAHLLRGRARRGDGAPAPEGQARHALARLVRGRVPRRAGPAAGRGGPRRRDDHRDGHAHAARLRDRERGDDAARRRRGRPPRAPPRRVRRPARRAAADGQRARRPRDRVRGRDGVGAPARPRLRRGRPRVPPLRHRGHEVLDLQAGDGARGRGARVPRRQRLRRGVADAAAAARRAAQRDLGGLGQRDLARRAARARRASPRGCPRSWPSASSAAAATRGSTPTWTRSRPRSPSWAGRRRSGWRGARSRTSRSPSRARCSSATRPPAVADAFCAGRLGDARGRVYGTLPRGVDGAAIAARALAM